MLQQIYKIKFRSFVSYCRLNPDGVVWFLTTSCALDTVSRERLAILASKFFNLQVATLNIAIALRSTPLEQLYHSNRFWQTGEWLSWPSSSITTANSTVGISICSKYV